VARRGVAGRKPLILASGGTFPAAAHSAPIPVSAGKLHAAVMVANRDAEDDTSTADAVFLLHGGGHLRVHTPILGAWSRPLFLRLQAREVTAGGGASGGGALRATVVKEGVSTKQYLNLDNEDAAVVRLVVDFLYTNELALNPANALTVYGFAQRYEVQLVRDLVVAWCIEHINAATVCHFIALGQHFGVEQLVRAGVAWICDPENTNSVIMDSDRTRFNGLPAEVVHQIVTTDALTGVTELELLKAVHAWALSDGVEADALRAVPAADAHTAHCHQNRY
jgi:hypothetical protein